MKKIAVIILSGAALCACSHSFAPSGGDHGYLKAQTGRDLLVPAALSDSNISHFYDLPRQEKKAGVSLIPPADKAADS